jgi:hypothetical protein
MAYTQQADGAGLIGRILNRVPIRVIKINYVNGWDALPGKGQMIINHGILYLGDEDITIAQIIRNLPQALSQTWMRIALKI